MTGRPQGSKNRNYPPLPLSKALTVASAIEDKASGETVSRLLLAELVDSTPTSRVFRDLVAASRFYDLTSGGINADEFGLTQLGRRVTSGDETEVNAALKLAVLSVPAYKTFYERYSGKKVPAVGPLREFMAQQAEVDPTRVDEAIDFMLQDGTTAGFIKEMKGSKWVDLAGTPSPSSAAENATDRSEDGPDAGDEADSGHTPDPEPPAPEDHGQSNSSTGSPPGRDRPNAIFLGHGKNRKPLDQLIKILDEYGIPHKEAIAEPNAGRPIPSKVADTMRQCGAAILIFSADEELFDADSRSVWRPSENVVHELGAASVLYDNRIVIFKEDTVSLASNFSSIGYISFEHDKLIEKGIELFRELVNFKIVSITVGG